MMSGSATLTHRLDGSATLQEARVFATETSRILGDWGLPADRLTSWEMAVAEMATNVARHGYPDGSGPMELHITWDSDGLEISVIDQGIAYDPNEVPPPPDPDPEDPSTWPEGGMGIMLVRSAGDELSYHRGDGTNTLTLFTEIPRKNTVL
jgi:serine/threonine-protein kinase RsbW